MNKKLTPQEEKLQERLEDSLKNRRMLTHRLFLSYAYDLFRHAKAYTVWKNLLSYFRKLRLVAIIIKILTIVLTVLETGALVILSTLVLLVLLPFLTAFMLGILITARIESRKSNRIMTNKLCDRQIYVLFLAKECNRFFTENAKDLAKKEKSAVIIISPYWISGKGLDADRFFCTVREEYPNLYLVRRYYFFTLKKHVLKRNTVSYIF